MTSSYRSFGGTEEIDSHVKLKSEENLKSDHVESLRQEIIGHCSMIQTPYGKKPLVYTDWTASGRSLRRVESYITQNVLPMYGNTHTTTSRTGHQSTAFRHEARQIVAESVNAFITGKAAVDVVLFCGNGVTAAITKLVNSLGLSQAAPWLATVDDSTSNDHSLDESYRPVVFTTSYEHHSNLLPWREANATVVTIAFDPITGVCLKDLEAQLVRYNTRRVKIGTFAAASNISGILTDVDSCAEIMHRHGGLAFFDYATAAPYVRIDMNPRGETNSLRYKDAVFFSGHKFLGGPGSPGVLIVKKWVLPQAGDVPSSDVGGGTVFYVTESHHRYLSNREEREEAGSPSLLSDVRMGLVLHLHRQFGFSAIETHEKSLNQRITQELSKESRLVLLGKFHDNSEKKEIVSNALPIFSFLIRCGNGFLHHHYVSVLLNDFFGIQSRGGCMCAGPYAQRLLGLDSAANAAYEAALLDKHEVLRPGVTRLSLPYWSSDAEIDYVVRAVRWVAAHGWKFLPHYRYNHKTGEWAHTTRLTRFPERQWISNFRLRDSDILSTPSTPAEGEEQIESFAWDPTANCTTMSQALKSQWNGLSEEDVYAQTFAAADAELQTVEKALSKAKAKGSSGSSGEPSLEGLEHLRWFVLADDTRASDFNPDGSSIPRGPIRPVAGFSDTVDPEAMEISSDDAELTAYAKQRDAKFIKRDGSDVALPRFLKLFQSGDDDETLLSKLRGSLAAVLATHVPKSKSAPTSSLATSVPASNPKTPKVAKPTAAEIVDAAKAAVAPVVNDTNPTAAEDEFFCPLDGGACTTLRAPPAVLSEGKILSGPGTVFTADPALRAPLVSVPKKLMKVVGQAVKEWGMIQEGDRLLLGLSGGKDSLALLHVLRALQRRAPIKFEIACATVDPQTESFDPSPLIPYVRSLGITYHYLSEPIVDLARSKLQGDSLCAFCARFKRGLLYSCCREFGYNKLVLAQHLDDLVESFWMSALHNGQLRTMKANYRVDAGDVRVIRPLCYARESATRDFSSSVGLPIINENCPACFEQPKERARMKKLMEQEEAMVPGLFFNLKKALLPLMDDESYAAMDNVNTRLEAAAKSRDVPTRGNSTKRVATDTATNEEEDAKRIRLEENSNNVDVC